jgi:hypothetical protein
MMRRRVMMLGALLAIFALAGSARAEIVQKGNLRANFTGELRPQKLPRSGTAPISVSIGGTIATTDRSAPPQLRSISIALNSNGRIDYRGLPTCALEDIQPSTNRGALLACRDSLVGQGDFSANVVLPQQSPFPARGRLLAFNGRFKGRPAILAHVYGTDPVPTSFTLPFVIVAATGTYGTVLRSSLPSVTGDVGYITGFSLDLGRRFSSHGSRRSYLSAGCPVPAGGRIAVFPFSRMSLGFEERTLSSVLHRTCKVR